MEFSRPEYWSGLPIPSPGNLPDPGFEPGSTALQADSLPPELPGKPLGEDPLNPLDSKEVKPINPKGTQLWIVIGSTEAEAEAPVLWPPNTNSWLTGKDPDVGKDWGQEEKGATVDEMVGWHHRLNGHEFEQLWELVKEREDWRAVHGSRTGGYDWVAGHYAGSQQTLPVTLPLAGHHTTRPTLVISPNFSHSGRSIAALHCLHFPGLINTFSCIY